MVVAREQYPAGAVNAYRHLNQRDFTDAVRRIPTRNAAPGPDPAP